MPSGRKTGHRCEFSPRSKSTSVAGCTGPPSADTRARPSKIKSGPNTIVPVGLHAPPLPSGASQMYDRYAAGDRHFHQFAAGKKPERPAVGRPERLLRSVGPIDNLGIARVE